MYLRFNFLLLKVRVTVRSNIYGVRVIKERDVVVNLAEGGRLFGDSNSAANLVRMFWMAGSMVGLLGGLAGSVRS